MENVISKVDLGDKGTFKIAVSDGTYTAYAPTMTQNSTLALTSDIEEAALVWGSVSGE